MIFKALSDNEKCPCYTELQVEQEHREEVVNNDFPDDVIKNDALEERRNVESSQKTVSLDLRRHY